MSQLLGLKVLTPRSPQGSKKSPAVHLLVQHREVRKHKIGKVPKAEGTGLIYAGELMEPLCSLQEADATMAGSTITGVEDTEHQDLEDLESGVMSSEMITDRYNSVTRRVRTK